MLKNKSVCFLRECGQKLEGWGQAARFQLALKSDPAGMKVKAESRASCTESSPQGWGRGVTWPHPPTQSLAPALPLCT